MKKQRLIHPERRIDLNSDVGESYGAYTLGLDAGVIPHISSANIACGYHAGNPAVMRKTVALALAGGAALGAHPGLPDLVGFGRRNMDVTLEEIRDMVTIQIGGMQAVAKLQGARLQHVKPHGALYNMAVKDPAIWDAVAHIPGLGFQPAVLENAVKGQIGAKVGARRDMGLELPRIEHVEDRAGLRVADRKSVV